MTHMIIISMDSHTELIANLKPFLPHTWHAEFDDGAVLARRYFAKTIESFTPFVAAGHNVNEMGFTALPDSGRPLTVEEYVRPLPLKERYGPSDWSATRYRRGLCDRCEAVTPGHGVARLSDDPGGPVKQHRCSIAAAWATAMLHRSCFPAGAGAEPTLPVGRTGLAKPMRPMG